jgi:hypothetical protein
LPSGITGSPLPGKILVPAAKYEGETGWREWREEHDTTGRRLSLIDPVVLAGVIVILALCICSKLFTSY